MGEHYLKFWGTRGSIAVSGEAYRHFGGNTSCCEVHDSDHCFIIDAGTGIRELGLLLHEQKIRKIDLLLTHTHWDHIIGLPFFEPIYHAGVHLTIWSLGGRPRSCEELFHQLFAEEFFPVEMEHIESKIEFRTIHSNSPIHIGPLVIHSHPMHHPGKACGFKFQLGGQMIGYASDNEVSTENAGRFDELVSFFKGCDLLIHEAQYLSEEYRSKRGWGHSSLPAAIALIQRALPRQWFVTHHDPLHTDKDLFRMAEAAKQMLHTLHIRCPVEWVCDGQVIEL